MNSNPTYERLLEASIHFVSYRPRSEKEIRDFLQKKLTRWKVYGGTVVQTVVDRLKELNYVDDAKFAAWWVEQRSTFRPKGTRLIQHELQAKGIHKDVEVRVDEVALARQAIKKKLPVWGKLPDLERKKKLYEFLSRRGFTYETIQRVVDEITGKE